jgi:hypothetical protein
MHFRSRVTSLLALALTLTVAACGDDEGSGRSYDDAEPEQTVVALFVDTAYVEFDTTDTDQEGSNLYFSLKERGFQVDTFSTTDSAAFAAVLAGADVLVLPEPEGDSYEDLPAGIQYLIRNFVEDGGTVAWFDYADEMNSIFDWELEYGDSVAYESSILKNGSIDPFTGPDSLPWADATDVIESSTLPAGTKMPYKAGSDAAVAVIPFGKGEVVYFGYDWYDAAPFGSQDGGWIELLDGLSKF